MQYLENGSWNKRLPPRFAAHDAIVCVAFAEAGVLGTAKPIGGKFGFLHSYSGNPDMNGLLDDLGREWTFTSTALKPLPAYRMTHFIDCIRRQDVHRSPRSEESRSYNSTFESSTLSHRQHDQRKYSTFAKHRRCAV